MYHLAEKQSQNVFYSIIMVKTGKIEVAKEDLYAAKKLIKIWDVNVDNIIISKLDI